MFENGGWMMDGRTDDDGWTDGLTPELGIL